MDKTLIWSIIPALLHLIVSVTHTFIDNKDASHIWWKINRKNIVSSWSTMFLFYYVTQLHSTTDDGTHAEDYIERVVRVLQEMVRQSSTGFRCLLMSTWVVHSDVVEWCKHYSWKVRSMIDWYDNVQHLRVFLFIVVSCFFMDGLNKQPVEYISDGTWSFLFVIVLTFGYQAMYIFNPLTTLIAPTQSLFDAADDWLDPAPSQRAFQRNRRDNNWFTPALKLLWNIGPMGYFFYCLYPNSFGFRSCDSE